MAELAAKKAVKAAAPAPNAPGTSARAEKKKEKKVEAVVEEWLNTTPKGEKKGELRRPRLGSRSAGSNS